MKHYLEFEKPIVELRSKIQELQAMQSNSTMDIETEITSLGNKLTELMQSIYKSLTPWQISQIARHPLRPRTIDYINNIFQDFTELHGDRHVADDRAIIGGLATFNQQTVMVIGHQKGRDTKENIQYNFGMPRPEGYRKALRLMQLAEKFNFPILTFVDTPGAYPGIGAEERNQSEAIGRNLFEMSKIKTPVIVTVIGEGGSGGALAIAVGDCINMLENSIYSVISPEGCASILWKDSTCAPLAADVLGITSKRAKSLGICDNIIKEPQGGAHYDQKAIMETTQRTLQLQLKRLNSIELAELTRQRLERIMAYGKFEEELSE